MYEKVHRFVTDLAVLCICVTGSSSNLQKNIKGLAFAARSHERALAAGMPHRNTFLYLPDNSIIPQK